MGTRAREQAVELAPTGGGEGSSAAPTVDAPAPGQTGCATSAQGSEPSTAQGAPEQPRRKVAGRVTGRRRSVEQPVEVLVVDDELGMRLGVARALEGQRVHLPDLEEELVLHVEQASSGEEALERILHQPPDLLLLDHKLPGMSGLDLIARLADRELDLLTVMITAYASLEIAVSATKKGAYDFLAKPFTPAELRAAVTKAVRHLVLQRKARRLAEEKRQVRFQFLSVLAHELKSPLSAVEGYLYLLRDRALGDDLAAYERMIQRTLDRTAGMRKLIYDLLDLTRIESGQKRREIEQVDLSELAGTVLENFEQSAAERSIEVKLDVPCGPLGLRGDRSELEIVLNNLVSNAIKYNREGGSVTVSLRPLEAADGQSSPDRPTATGGTCGAAEAAGAGAGDQGESAGVIIEVSDTGIGMSPEAASRLFNEFVRIKSDKTRHILGSGLGLSIVKKLATMYGGDASVQSEPERGSTFTVVLRHAVESAAERT